MKNKNKVYIWYNINFLSIIFKYSSNHYFLNCNQICLYILKTLNFKVHNIDLKENIFDKKKKNLFYQIDYFIHKYSNKIFNKISKNSYKYSRHNLIERIYLSFISEDIKENCVFFVRTKDKLLKDYPDNKIIYIFHKSEFSKNLLIELNQKYKDVEFKFNRNLFKINLFLKVVFLNFTLVVNKFKSYKYKIDKPKIFQEHIENIFNRYPNSGHLFWLKGSKIKFSDISWFHLIVVKDTFITK